MKSGNIQKAKCILDVFTKANSQKACIPGAIGSGAATMTGHSSSANLFNSLDYNGMRAIDLLSIRQESEKNK